MTPSAYIDRHASQLPRRLRRLVRLPTVNPPGECYGEMAALLAGELAGVGLKAERLRSSAGRFPRYNVLAKWRSPGARRTLHFNAHYDVVPVSGRWRHGSPFSGTVSQGWIHGRGTADMKGSIASLLLALEALRATGARPAANVEVSFTADEETDSVLGAEWLVRRAPIEPDFAVVMEGGEGGTIGCGHNGVVWLEVAVRGRAAHGSRPEAGVNALEQLSALVLALDDYKRLLSRRSFAAPDGKVLRPTLNVGGVFGGGEGGKINTVPAYGSFTLDRRVIPGEANAAVERELRAFLASAAARIPRCRMAVTKISENFPSFVRPDHPFFTAVRASVRRVRGGRPRFSVSTGFNDAQFFAQTLGIPTAGYGPGGRNEHAVDERARLADLSACAKIYSDLLTSFAG